MANRTGVVRFTSKLNNANDAFPGGGDASPGQVPGMLGAEIEVDGPTAAALSDTSVATLRSGRYRYVQSLAGGTTAPSRGRAALQSTSAQVETNVVHSDGATEADGKCAGVFLNTVTKGNCTWIQVAGNADCLMKNGITATTDGCVAVVGGGTALFDVLADATATTNGTLRATVGIALGTATDNAISKVLLKYVPLRAGGN
jgi:hypothetical protein